MRKEIVLAKAVQSALAPGTPVVARRAFGRAKLFVYALLSGPDRVGLIAESTRFVATFGAEIRDLEVGVVRHNVHGALNFEISRPGLRMMRPALCPFKVRTGLSIKVFDVVDVEPIDDLNDPPEYLEFAVASDCQISAIADTSELVAHHQLNVVVARTERFRVKHSAVVQMRQRYIVYPKAGFNRISFINELEGMISRKPYNGAILLPPRLTTSKIW